MEALEGPQGVGGFISGFQLRRFDMLPSIAVGAIIVIVTILLTAPKGITNILKR